ncbi:MAG: hypothetical protein FD167_5648, partial [bacterium]
SNTILPLESIPVYLKHIVLYNPFVVGEAALKRIIVFTFSLDRVGDLLSKLVWYNLILVVVTYLGLKRSKEKISK